jgi:acetyl-CoA carboxylase biotin carboxyl carrier protein
VILHGPQDNPRSASKKEGDTVAVGDTIGLIEVMKTFTPVIAEAAGRVVKFVAENEEAIMAGQPLLEIDG